MKTPPRDQNRRALTNSPDRLLSTRPRFGGRAGVLERASPMFAQPLSSGRAVSDRLVGSFWFGRALFFLFGGTRFVRCSSAAFRACEEVVVDLGIAAGATKRMGPAPRRPMHQSWHSATGVTLDWVLRLDDEFLELITHHDHYIFGTLMSRKRLALPYVESRWPCHPGLTKKSRSVP